MSNKTKIKRTHKKNKTRKTRKIVKPRQQKIWNQKGCSVQKAGKCGCGLPFGGKIKGWKGGQGCALCQQNGGNSSIIKNPGPFIGPPWTPNVENWPGVGMKQGETNYYPLNTNTYSDYHNMKPAKGGKTRAINKNNKTKKSGGGFLGQDLVNLGRTLSFGLGSAYNAVSGYSQPLNPLPYKDQLLSRSKY
jgi:hypothetical protein